MEKSPIVDLMFENDAFSQWLGIERISDAPGKSHLKMQIRKEMLNGFGIAHGAITYALADSALAFASNAHGRQSVSIETSISHLLPLKEGDSIETKVNEISLNHRIALYQIDLLNQDQQLVASFKGTVYRKSEEW